MYASRLPEVVLLSRSNNIPNLTISLAVSLAHFNSIISSWSGFNLFRATQLTNTTRGNMCRNPSYNNIGLQPQCLKREGADYLRVMLARAQTQKPPMLISKL